MSNQHLFGRPAVRVLHASVHPTSEHRQTTHGWVTFGICRIIQQKTNCELWTHELVLPRLYHWAIASVPLPRPHSRRHGTRRRGGRLFHAVSPAATGRRLQSQLDATNPTPTAEVHSAAVRRGQCSRKGRLVGSKGRNGLDGCGWGPGDVID